MSRVKKTKMDNEEFESTLTYKPFVSLFLIDSLSFECPLSIRPLVLSH